MANFSNMFNGMFGRIGSDMCRLSMNGEIAVKTSTGYKTYNLKTKRLTNCDSFVFNIGDEMFFVIPTNTPKPGDILLVNGKPKCVVEINEDTITAVDYESSEKKQIIPERHVFMGSTYFYGKIVSIFGSTDFMKGKKGTSRIMQFMMMNEMMKGMNGGSSNGAFSGMLPMMLFMNNGGNMGNMFEMFNFDFLSDNGDEGEPDCEKASEEA